MRGSAIILAAVLLAVAFVPTAEAEAPAEVYFFNGDVCTAQVYLKPGTPIGSQIPELPGWADCWSDETGHKVTPESTFGSGAHTVTAWAGEPVPVPESGGGFTVRTAAGILGGVLILAAFIGLAVYLYRRD